MDPSFQWQCTQCALPLRSDKAACYDELNQQWPGKTGHHRKVQAAGCPLPWLYPTVMYPRRLFQHQQLSKLHQSTANSMQVSIRQTKLSLTNEKMLFKFLLIDILLLTQSVLWRCWLGNREGIRPVKNWVVGSWHGYLSGTRHRFAYGPADATATHCLLLK